MDFERAVAESEVTLGDKVATECQGKKPVMVTVKEHNKVKSIKLSHYIPEQEKQEMLLRTIYYEARRAGLDPELILAIVDTESHFRKYAISSKGARGYMQIMPLWVKQIGSSQDNLFHLRTNLHYGCTIFRHYLDIEEGNIVFALGRYHGARGKNTYANRVISTWNRWQTPALSANESEPPVQSSTNRHF